MAASGPTLARPQVRQESCGHCPIGLTSQLRHHKGKRDGIEIDLQRVMLPQPEGSHAGHHVPCGWLSQEPGVRATPVACASVMRRHHP
jgi:hypothetical protein